MGGMTPQFRLKSLLALVLACAMALGLLRGVIWEPEPQWGFYLIGLVGVCASIVAIMLTMLDAEFR
jgi:hypothetical protein